MLGDIPHDAAPGREVSMGEAQAQRAKDRANSAAVRAEELGERGARLRAGVAVDANDVAAAKQAARLQVIRSKQAHLAAGQAHQDAADIHRKIANLLDLNGKHDKAETHRAKAVAADAAAADDRAKADAEPV